MKALRGKTALLTGGSRGIGPVIGQALINEGVNLALTARSGDKLVQIAQDLGQVGGRVIAIPANLADPATHEWLLRQLEAQLGAPDILINNAAIEQPSHFSRQAPSDIQAIIQTNLVAPLLLTRQVLPGMIARGQGHIVNIASMAGKKAPPYNAVYGATKAALIEWTGALRGELEDTGVSASVICPGFISETGMFVDNYVGQKAPWLMGQSRPEEVAQAVIQAIKQNVLEVLVTPRPARPFLALDALWPEIASPFLKWLGVTKLFRQAAEQVER